MVSKYKKNNYFLLISINNEHKVKVYSITEKKQP